MDRVRQLLSRAVRSAVIWSWGMNGLRLASGVLLLPLLVFRLSPADLGMHYVLLSLGALAPILDFGFSGAVWRAVSHAAAGGKELPVFGLESPPTEPAPPNTELMWQLMAAARGLYLRLALVSAVLVGPLGTLLVAMGVAETSAPAQTWFAWAMTLTLVVWEVYASWWSSYLMGLDRMVLFVRINFFAYLLKLAGSALLLWLGAGLLSVPVAGFAAVLVQRTLARRACLQTLGTAPATPTPAEVCRSLLARLWPNASRVGLLSLGNYVGGQAMAFLCLATLGLTANAEYGLSLQIMGVVQGIAMAWTQVKWPLLAQQRTRGDVAGMRHVFRERLWLQLGTFAILAAVAVPLAPAFLHWLGTDKVMLPMLWLVVLAVNSFLEMHLSTWGMLIYTDNRLPVLWPILLANAASMTLAFALLQTTTLGLGALVIAPLLAGLAYNYWHWPRAGCQLLETSWSKLMFTRQPPPPQT